MKCQMSCGRCPNDATLVAETGGKLVTYINFGAPNLAIVKRKAPKRTVYACAAHRKPIEDIAEREGGTVRAL